MHIAMSEQLSRAPLGRWDVLFAVLGLVCGAVLLFLGRSLTFWFDDWTFVTFSGSGWDYFRPHNEHLIALPLALFRATFAIVGLQSYLPYLVELIALHLLTVAAAYLLMRRRLGPAWATVLSVPLLFLGAGSENLYWAFQATFVGSVLFGLWALVFVEAGGRRSAAIASLMLLGSVLCSAMGLFFVVAVFARTFLDAGLRRRVSVVVPSVAAYAAWYIAFGRAAVGDQGAIAGPLGLAKFVARGLGHSIAAMLGVDALPGGVALGFAVLFALAVATVLGYLRGRRLALAGGCLLALVAMYASVGLVRADLDDSYETRSRYTYVAAFFLVLVLVDLLTERQWMSRMRRRWASALALGAVVVYASSVSSNLDELHSMRGKFQFQSELTRTYIALALARGDEAWVDQGFRFNSMPPVRELASTVAKSDYRSDVRDVAKPGDRAFADAVLLLVGDGFRVEPVADRGEPVMLRLVEERGAVATSTRGCVRVVTSGNGAEATVATPGGVRIRVTSQSEVLGTVGLRYESSGRYTGLRLERGSSVDITVPDIEGIRRWRLVFALPGQHDRVTLCARRTARVTPGSPMSGTGGPASPTPRLRSTDG
jgi:hypothetical protein